MAVKVRKLNKVPLVKGLSSCIVKTCGNVIEVTARLKESSGSSGCPCRKISEDEYIDERTGEIGLYQHGENRGDVTRSFRNSLRRIRDVINTNVTEPENALFFTFTYAENMQDPERLYTDFKKWWQKFKRWCVKNGTEEPQYIFVPEPQGRGAWHGHVIIIWPHKAPYVPNNEVMERLWPHGFTKTQAIHGVDNVGAYFSAYLADIPLEDFTGTYDPKDVSEKEFRNLDGSKSKKKFIKGARAKLYPSGMNIVRHSRGLKEPEVQEMDWNEAKEKVSDAAETFKTAFTVEWTSGEEIQTYVRIYYNKVRKKSSTCKYCPDNMSNQKSASEKRPTV